METLFWTSAIVIAYVYAGYPLLMRIRAALAAAPTRRCFAEGRWPSISIVVAARNERARLPGRIENLLTIRYGGPREIIVVSDGSSDGTADALARFGDRIRFIELSPGGKPQALNAGVAAATGEIVVFADARQRFGEDALPALVSAFTSPDVGGATGELVLDCEYGQTRSTVGDGMGAYWKYEKWLRRQESRVRTVLGATGAIYALRRSLWQPLPADTLLDDVLAPMRAVLAGWRIVFVEEARAFDRTAPDTAAEARRKRRTLAGNYQILAQEPRLILPVANPVWLEYMSHKVGRLVVPWALLGLLLASIVLAGRSWPYALALGLQAVFYVLAAVGAWLDARERRAAGGLDGGLRVSFGKEMR